MATLITRTQLGAVEIDCTVSDNLSEDAEVTDHPIEVGADVTDHVRPKPTIVTLEGIVSDAALPRDTSAQKITVSATRGGNVAADPNRAIGEGGRSGSITTSVQVFKNNNAGRAKTAFDTLRTMRANATVFTLVTARATYENMVITNLSFPVDKSLRDAVKFNVTCKQIVRATSQTVTVSRVSEDKLKKTVDKSKKAAEPAEPTKKVSSLGTLTGQHR